MAQRPAEYINWTNGAPPAVVEPPSSVKNQGWFAGEAPPAEYMNWLFWMADQWVQYLDGVITPGTPDQLIRLMNGGFWSWNLGTTTLAWSAAGNISFPGVPDSNNQFPAGSVNLNDGDIAYVNVNIPLYTKGDTSSTSNPNIITNVNFTGGITPGMTVTGPGIPGGTTVVSVGTGNVTISANATSNNTQASYIFSASTALTVLTVSNASFNPTAGQIMLARRTGSIVYVGVNTGQMVLRDGESKPLLGAGYFTVYSATAGENLTAGQLVYISPGSSDGGRTAGRLYKLDVSAVNQAVRGTFAGQVITTVLAGNPATILYNGFFGTSGLTAGVAYYADPATPGGFTSAIPTGAGEKIMQIGFATTTTTLLIGPVGGGTGSSGSFTQPLFLPPTIIGYGDGTTVSFPLGTTPLNANSIFAFQDGAIQPNTGWTQVGNNIVFNTAPAVGIEVSVYLVLAGQAFVVGNQQLPTGVVDGVNTTFGLASQPLNQVSLQIYIDGVIYTGTFTLNFLSDGSSQFVLPTAPSIGQDLYATWLSPVGVQSTVPPVDIHGSAAAPVPIVPSQGITPTGALRQLWWIKPSSGSGAVNITATPPIAAGLTVGQELELKSVASANYLTIPNVTGVDQDSTMAFGPTSQSSRYIWDGSNWSLCSRRF